MKIYLRRLIYCWILAASFIECRENFVPDFVSGIDDYLVIEGYINIGVKKKTQINLSRVMPIGNTQLKPENNSIVRIEDELGTTYALTQIEDGRYQSDSLSLTTDLKYRLLITTSNGVEYASALTQVYSSPVIDSLTWSLEDEEAKIYVNTHFTTEEDKFLKWDFTKTWEYHADYKANFKYVEGSLVPRATNEINDLFFCWRQYNSTDLNLWPGNSMDNESVRYPILSINPYSEEASVRFSLLVEQRSLSKAEFDFLQIMNRNSTITGSLFDPLPSEIDGNVICLSNPKIKAIGYIGAYTSHFMRLFILADELNVESNSKCIEEIVYPPQFNSEFGTGRLLPISCIFDVSPTFELTPITATGAATNCMDCKLKGGSSIRPSFW